MKTVSRLLAALATATLAADLPPGSPSIEILARTVAVPAGLLWGWSGSGARVAFEGTGCRARLSAPGAIYSVWIDGQPAPPLDLRTDSGAWHQVARGLPPRRHLVEIRKRTEARSPADFFGGFQVDGQPAPLPPGSGRRLEFFGNSITCGYGVLDTAAEHGFDLATEDESSSYAAVAADLLGADRRSVCWSGRGLLRNYGGDTVEPVLPRLQRRVLPWNPDSLWDASRWPPQAVVVNLGTNDFSAGLPDSARFLEAVLGLVRELALERPGARFLLLDGPMVSDAWPPGRRSLTHLRNHLDLAAARLSAEGIATSRFSLPPQGALGYGADWHPNRAQARRDGEALSRCLAALLGWGDPTSTPR